MTGITKYWLIAGGAALAALMTISVILALVDSEAQFPTDSPEAAVQRMLRAAEDGDGEAIYAMLSETLRGKCPAENFLDANAYGYGGGGDIQAVLEDTKSVNGATVVSVNVRRFDYGDSVFYGGGGYGYHENYRLAQEGGEWKFTDYPWPYGYCDETE